MPTFELSEETYRRVAAFVPVARAVLDEDVDVVTCAGLLVDLGFQVGLRSVIGNQEDSVHVESQVQLALEEPETVCNHIAHRVGLGADIRAWRERPRRIGFVR